MYGREHRLGISKFEYRICLTFQSWISCLVEQMVFKCRVCLFSVVMFMASPPGFEFRTSLVNVRSMMDFWFEFKLISRGSWERYVSGVEFETTLENVGIVMAFELQSDINFKIHYHARTRSWNGA